MCNCVDIKSVVSDACNSEKLAGTFEEIEKKLEKRRSIDERIKRLGIKGK